MSKESHLLSCSTLSAALSLGAVDNRLEPCDTRVPDLDTLEALDPMLSLPAKILQVSLYDQMATKTTLFNNMKISSSI